MPEMDSTDNFASFYIRFSSEVEHFLEKIEFVWDTAVEEIIADQGGVHSIKVKNLKTGEETIRETNGLFMGIGHNPNTGFLDGQLDLDEHGFINTVAGTPDTSIAGIFACGDVQDSYYRQAISAAGTGCMAAMRAERFMEDAK